MNENPSCHWCGKPATRFDDFGEYCCAEHGIHSDRPKLGRYQVTTKWWELVEPPRWMASFWFTEMIWNLTVHRSCSLTTYHDAEAPWLAQVAAYEYVTKHMPGPQYRVLVGRARRIV